MTDKVEVIHRIVFELDQLGANNAASEFEHLCRHLARQTICQNILPATGPVQAGGDQGRDFETFSVPDGNVHAFFGRSSSLKAIAFACSLQVEPEKGKIHSDVKSILGSGKKVDAIYFFSNRAINVSKRHEVENAIKRDFGVDLNILDRPAIAEQLAEPSTFWIASRFLSIPHEEYPRPLNENENYAKDREKWSKINAISGTFEEFEEIRRAGRYVYKKPSLKQDIQFWVEKLALFCQPGISRGLQRSALYERVVIRYVGTGTCLGDEDSIRDYLSDFEQFIDSSNLVDAQCFLAFIHGATKNNAVEIPIAEIDQHVEALIHLVERLLTTTSNASARCQLLETKFSIVISIRKEGASNAEAATKVNSSLEEIEKILELLPNAPLFPLESLVNHLRRYIEMFIDAEIPVDVSRLEKLAVRLDEEFLANRYGGFKAAESARDRAIMYFEKDRYLDCIALLHRAKLLWFADETLKGSIISIYLIASCYERLGLNFAAKYYYLAGAHVAVSSNKKELFILLSRGLFHIADCEYATGAWIRFFSMMRFALLARQEATSEYPAEGSDELPALVYYPAIVKYMAERFGLEVQDKIAQRLQQLPAITQDDVDAMSEILDEKWRDLSLEDLEQFLSKQIHGLPFSDICVERLVAWKADGIFWMARFQNDYETTMVAEQLIAILQILNAELAKDDLHYLRGEARIEIIVDKQIQTPDLSRVGNNQFAAWVVKLPSAEPNNWKIMHDDLNSRYLALAMQILSDCSMLNLEDFLERIHSQFKEDLSNKLWLVNRYEVLYHEYFPESVFDEDQQIRLPSLPFTTDPEESPLLTWKSTLSPYYSVQKSHTQIRNRYTNAIKSIRLTLEKYRDNPIFKSYISILRSHGWLDWHILTAMTNRAANYRYDSESKIGSRMPTFDEMKKATRRYIETEETSTSIEIPMVEFSPQELAMYLSGLGPVTVATTWGLESHMETPNAESVLEFMTNRFNYMTDDVEHEQVLPPTPN